jgi:hypothetical protein
MLWVKTTKTSPGGDQVRIVGVGAGKTWRLETVIMRDERFVTA